MSKWNEIAKGYSLTITPEGIKGRKVYRTASNGSIATDAGLPQINVTSFTAKSGTTYADCKAVRMTETHTDARAGNDAFQDRTYDFDTPSSDNNLDQTIEAQEDQLSFTVGGENETIDDPSSSWVWDGTSDPVTVPIYRRKVTGSIIRRVYVTGLTALEVYLPDVLADRAGFISTKEMWGFPAGQILFNGASGSSEYDPVAEDIKYAIDLEFLWKDVGKDGDDWNYILDEDTGTYKKPVTSAGSLPLYSSLDLFELIEEADA